MNQEDRDRLMRIETVLEKVVVPQLTSYGPRIKKLENFKTAASILWGGVCVIGWVAKDAAAEWLKRKVIGS